MTDTRPACLIHKPTYDDRCQDCYVAALEARLMEQRARGDDLEEALRHRARTNEEQESERGLLAGYCIRCNTPWPCEVERQNTAAAQVKDD